MELIAEGRTAEVYAWGEERVLKLLKPGFEPRILHREAAHTRTAHALGLPVPDVGEFITREGRLGCVFERVQGRNLQEASPNLESMCRRLASLHALIHGYQAETLPRLTTRLEHDVNRAPLADSFRARALTVLRNLDEGDTLCHGDFHPGNILVPSEGKPVIIDWLDACAGNPLADVARTMVLLGGWPYYQPDLERYQQQVQGAITVYVDHYRNLTGAPREAIEAWVMPVAAARLAEDVAAEDDYLRGLVMGDTLL